MTATTFASLDIGATFDFVAPPPASNSFFARCTKVGPRTYSYVNAGPAAVKAPRRLSDGRGYNVVYGATLTTRVGTVHATVYNVRCPRCDLPSTGRLATDSTNRLSCAVCAVI